MTKTKKLFSIFCALTILCSGCFSTKHQLSINAAYPFEGRYDSTSSISINQNPIHIQEKDSIWILSNHTLYNLLTSVSDSNDKVIFKASKRDYLFSSNKFKEKEIVNGDSFDNEEYVWEKWIEKQ